LEKKRLTVECERYKGGEPEKGRGRSSVRLGNFVLVEKGRDDKGQKKRA